MSKKQPMIPAVCAPEEQRGEPSAERSAQGAPQGSNDFVGAPPSGDLVGVLARLRELAEAECTALESRCFSALSAIAAERSELGLVLASNEGRLRGLLRERPDITLPLLEQTMALDRRSLDLAAGCLQTLEEEKRQIELLRSWLSSQRETRRGSALRGQYFDRRC